MNHFEHSLLRALKGDVVVGAAFLVRERLVATCAHVVIAAGWKRGDMVRLKTAQGVVVNGEVLPEYWRDVNAEDIAFLRLQEELEGIEPLPLGSSTGTKDDRFSTFGFPKPTQELAGRGEIIGEATLNQLKYLQLDSKQVTPGFSGAPVYDENTRRVVGMIMAITPPDEYQRQGTTAFAISSETLRAVCPEIQLKDVCPYLNLDSFEERDAEYFFGRKRVIQKLIESLKREPRFLVLLGPSGSGKSSVMKAGLIPSLKRGAIPGSEKWEAITIRPGDDPFGALEEAGLQETGQGFEHAAGIWLNDHPGRTRLLIVIDQFEQLLVSTPEDIRRKFIAELVKLLDSRLGVTVMMTMRDDFYSRFQLDAAKLADWFEHGLVNIPLWLTREELESIITGPANVAGLNFEEGLAETIAVDVMAQSQNGDDAQVTILPLLEFALTQLWEMRQDNIMTHDAYRDIAGVTGGLAKWASSTYDSLDKNERRMARLILELLVHPADENQGIPDIRQARPIPEIVRENEILTRRTIDKLVNARLLTIKRDERTGVEIVEIIHDSLLVEWGSLKAWLDEDRPSLQIQQQLTEAAREWERHNFERSYLFRGLRLTELEKWAAKSEYKLNEPDEKFLKDSSAERARQTLTTRIFWSMAAVLTLALLIAGPGIWIYREYLRRTATGMSQIVRVLGGTMEFGTSDPERQDYLGEAKTTPVDVATISMETTEVTYEQYGLCVKAKRCDDPIFTQPVDTEALKDRPAAYVTLYQAMDYCTWLGRRLPDTFEWELAARGVNGRPWPWYEESLPADDPKNLVSEDKGYFLTAGRHPTDSAPVGSYPNGATPEGVLDLYGNVWEWTSSAVNLDDFAVSGWDGDSEAYIIQRGAAWDSALDRITQIRLSQPVGSDPATGFRCVTEAPP